MSLIFYDIETTGTSKHFDQIVQFAAICTSHDLTEIGRFEIRSRLQPHIIPSPGALHATRVSIDDLLDAERPSHYQMVCAIRKALSAWCPATFLGYNSLRFDEEFLRQAFYQCLHPAYLTNTGGSGRADVLNIVRAAVLAFPKVLSVPQTETGKATYKLDRLAPANGFAHENAHDALADVEATIHVCRLIRDAAPGFWAAALRLSRKAAALDYVQGARAFALFEGAGAGCVANIVTPLGPSRGEPNVWYCLDLRCDLDELGSFDDDELGKRLSASLRPIRRLKVNAAPIALDLTDIPDHLLGDRSAEQWIAAADQVRRDTALIARLIAASEPEDDPHEASPHVEQQIYDGFWGDADARLLERFHRVSWEERVVVARGLEDLRLKRLARRLIYFERPDLLPETTRSAMAAEIEKRRVGAGEAGESWLTLGRAAEELEALLARLPADAHGAFDTYRRFIGSAARSGTG